MRRGGGYRLNQEELRSHISPVEVSYDALLNAVASCTKH